MRSCRCEWVCLCGVSANKGRFGFSAVAAVAWKVPTLIWRECGP